MYRDPLARPILILILMICSTKPLLGHHALVRVVGFRMAGFMLSGSGIRVCVLGNVDTFLPALRIPQVFRKFANQ